MSFDAGGMASKLGLDLSDYATGMLQATSIAQLFPQTVQSFLANPLLGVIDVAQQAAGAIHGLVSSWLGAVQEIGRAADDAGESAAKLGVSVEFLTGWGAAFSDAGSSAEGLGEALKFLNDNAAEASRGGKAAVDAFADIGISADFLKTHLNDTEAIARATIDAIAKLPTTAEQVRASRNLLGRGGADALAAIQGGTGGLDEFAETIRRLGGTIDGDLAKAGDKFGTFETLVGAALQGVKKAAAEPVLDLLAAHFGDVKGGIVTVSEQIQEAVRTAVEQVIDWGRQGVQWIQENKQELLAIADVARNLAGILSSELVRSLQQVVSELALVADQVRFLDNVLQPIGGLAGLVGVSGLGTLSALTGGGDSGSNPRLPSGQPAIGGLEPGQAAPNIQVTVNAQGSTVDQAFEQSVIAAHDAVEQARQASKVRWRAGR
jgi:hypothetical protein